MLIFKLEEKMNNPVIKSLLERRSIRSYKPEMVDESVLDEILRAGTYAATGMNRQSPIIIAVKDKEVRETIRKMNAEIIGSPDSDPFYGAPIILIVLADPKVPTYVEDGSLVLGNMMNAAHALGVGSCWIHRAKQEFESEEGKLLLKSWGVDGNYVGIGHLAIGYINGEYPPARDRKQNYIYKV